MVEFLKMMVGLMIFKPNGASRSFLILIITPYTRIYCCAGWLRKLFLAETLGFCNDMHRQWKETCMECPIVKSRDKFIRISSMLKENQKKKKYL